MGPLPLNNSKDMHTETENEQVTPIAITKYVIFKNLVAISVGSLLILTTADVLEVYQSTLNVEGGVGIASVAVQNACSVIAALFLPKYLLKRFGSKAVVVLSIAAFVPFVVVNFKPLYPLMILSSVCIGMGMTLYMGAVDPYINDLATFYSQLVAAESDAKESTKSDDVLPGNVVSYLPYQTIDKVGSKQVEIFDFAENSIAYTANVGSETTLSEANGVAYTNQSGTSLWGENSISFPEYRITHKTSVDTVHSATSQSKATIKNHNSESTTSQFFGLYSMLYQTSFMWGSLMSFYVLQNGYAETKQFAPTNDTCICGAGYCTDMTVCLEQNLMQPSTNTRNILISICLGLCIAAGVVVIIFFNDLKPKVKNVSLSLQMLLATFRQAQKRNHLLLIPMTVHNGMLRAFYLTDFTKSYVGCAWGIEHVGLVTACGGGTVALTSTVSGWLVKYTGRRPVFATAAALNMGLNVMMLMWRPDPDVPEMFFVAAVIWGVVFGTFYTQTKALYGVLFKEDEEAAFGACQLWQCVGSCLCLAYSNFICNNVKIYILTVVCVLGMIGYFLVEESHAKESKESSLCTTNKKDGDCTPEVLTDTFVNEKGFSREAGTHF